MSLRGHDLRHISGDAFAGLEGFHEIQVVGDGILRFLVEDQARAESDDVVGIDICKDVLEDNPRNQQNGELKMDQDGIIGCTKLHSSESEVRKIE